MEVVLFDDSHITGIISLDSFPVETDFGRLIIPVDEVRDIVFSGDGVYTRTGRRFFDDATMERGFLDRVRQALNRSGFWDDFKTDWVCLDCELMPWSAKAQELLKTQYSAVGTAAIALSMRPLL